ncbi:MAG: sulfite exporter TauE/SafE family protein [Nitrospinota bacterium]
MSQELLLLLFTSATIALIHTLLGPDHYLPFIVIAKARNWPYLKTLSITALCGLGHVLGSVVLGIIGIAFGVLLSRLAFFESFRGDLAAWALIAFGLVYFTWGMRKAIKNKNHIHAHAHYGFEHTHNHTHTNEHSHIHPQKAEREITPWILFTVFLFGPCEPLIPVLMYPAAKEGIFETAMVTLVFGVVTILTMVTVVSVFFFGLKKIPPGGFSRYSHALAGGTIFLCGGAIQFLGL